MLSSLNNKIPSSIFYFPFLLSTALLAQAPPPLDYEQRSQAQSHPGYVDLRYEKEFYNNGKLEKEGWVFMWKDSTGQRVNKVNIGKVFYYRKNGDFEKISFIPLSDTAESSVALLKNNQYCKYITYRQSENPKPLLSRYCVRTYYTRKSEVGNIKKDYCKSSPCKKDGPFLKYHTNNEIKVKGQYKHGKRVGEWKYFDSNRKLKRIRSAS